MTYRTDPYWRLYGSGAKEPQQGFQTNAKFYRPSKRIRFLEAQKQLDGGLQNYELKRGYLRGLPQPGIHSADFRPMKLGFQFNPQQIRQSVQMREDVYLPIMQDPTQFTQPFAGSVNFGFDLLFDRSAEVATATTSDMAATFREADLENPDSKSDAADIGVLADLQVLYSIIGQGFSAELLEFQAARLKQSAAYLIDPETDTGINESNIDEKARNFVNDMNLGNAAFLIPNPVRLIFSSLFMVDGFVTGTNVDFLKFNTAMVPIQARVTIDMNAIYIGFAREKTFLTAQLEEAAKVIEQERQEEIATNVELASIASTNVKYFAYLLGSGGQSTIEDVDTEEDSTDVWKFCIKKGYVGSVAGSSEWQSNFAPARKLKAGWLNSSGLSDIEIDAGEGEGVTNAKVTDTATISYTMYINIHGPYDTSNEADTATAADNYGSEKHVAQYEISTSTASGEWDDGQSTFDLPENTAPDAPVFGVNGTPETYWADWDEKYFAVRVTTAISVSSPTNASSVIRKEVSRERTFLGVGTLVHDKTIIPWTDPSNGNGSNRS